MIRDPLAELWALSPRRRSSGSLSVPVKHPASGNLVWLSIGQWLTLLWLRRRMRYGRGETTLVLIGAATNAHAGTVTHRLDRSPADPFTAATARGIPTPATRRRRPLA